MPRSFAAPPGSGDELQRGVNGGRVVQLQRVVDGAGEDEMVVEGTRDGGAPAFGRGGGFERAVVGQ